jgi:hypothetical protein
VAPNHVLVHEVKNLALVGSKVDPAHPPEEPEHRSTHLAPNVELAVRHRLRLFKSNHGAIPLRPLRVGLVAAQSE